MEFKCKLKVLLWERDIKQGDFAKRIGISRATMSTIVNSKSLPGFETAYKICEELDKTVQEIWIKK
jgi:putative transcriptional regulator